MRFKDIRENLTSALGEEGRDKHLATKVDWGAIAARRRGYAEETRILQRAVWVAEESGNLLDLIVARSVLRTHLRCTRT